MPLGLILIISFSRLIPHPPNFTPLIAVAILSGHFFKNLYISITIVLISVFLTDIILGFYPSMLILYLSLVIIVLSFHRLINYINFKNLFLYGLSGSIIFFIFSNFGVWMFGGLYDKNINGFLECYLMAIPFFKNTVASTLLFSYATLAAYRTSNNYFSVR